MKDRRRRHERHKRLASSTEAMAPNDETRLLLLRSKYPVPPADTRPPVPQATDATSQISTTPGETRRVIEFGR